jgi:hypothetical protein
LGEKRPLRWLAATLIVGRLSTVDCVEIRYEGNPDDAFKNEMVMKTLRG